MRGLKLNLTAVVVFAALCGFTHVPDASAAVLIESKLSAVDGIENDRTNGEVFRVNTQPLYVTALGLYDAGNDGFVAGGSVGIWADGGGAPLATVSFGPGLTGTLSNGWRYLSITPITLNALTNYVIGGYHINAALDNTLRESRYTFTNDIKKDFTYPTVTRYSLAASFVYPANGANGSPSNTLGRGAGNFQYQLTPIPEPVGLAMLAIGAAGMIRRRA